MVVPLSKLEEQIYELKLKKVETLINEKLLGKVAAKRKITVQALVDAEVTAKVGLVTEQEVESFYQANIARIRGEKDKVREKIRAYLQNQKLASQREAFLKSLRSQAKVVVNLKPPPVFSAEVKSERAGDDNQVLGLSLSLLQARAGDAKNLPQDERYPLLSTLIATDWNISRAAETLHWSRMTIYRKMAKYDITRNYLGKTVISM